MSSSSSFSSSHSSCNDCLEHIKDIYSWRNKTTTSAYLLSINLLYFLIFVLNKSLLSVFAYIFLFFMLVGLSLKCVYAFDNQQEEKEGQNVNKKVELISKECIEDILLYIYTSTNEYVGVFRDIVIWRDTFFSLKICIIIYICSYLCAYISFYFLLYIIALCIFSFNFFKSMYNTYFKAHVHLYLKKTQKFINNVFLSIPKMDDLKK